MRWSSTLIPTRKEDPGGATARSHQLMLRAGLIRQVGSGAYAYLPLGTRVLNKVVAIVREEMDRCGAIELHMPALWPRELLQESGRVEVFGEDLFSLSDRHGRPHVLAPTHEEVVTAIVRDDVTSYRQLPVILYQIQTKFRDEPRPRFGVLRTREFLMKDAYSFSADAADLDECYMRVYEAYERIFRRCGLRCVVVEAESGAMGGESSHEFMVPSPIGSDSFVRCTGCGYAANVERAPAPTTPPAEAPEQEPVLREVETPGMTTIEQVSRFLDVTPDRLIKTLVYVADGRPVCVLVRGDHEVNETKLARMLAADSLSLADAETIEKLTGAPVGFAGPVGLRGCTVLVDHAAAGVRDGVTGANKADAHLTGVVPGRDFEVGETVDVRYATPEDRCWRCGAALEFAQGIEVGHTFKLGTKYSKALNAYYLDAAGARQPYVMGCYGIGINRIPAALIESSADDDGIVWCPNIAPYEVLVLPLDMSDEKIVACAEEVYATLQAEALDVLLDDRDERPGPKFKDADLIGVPLRVVIGKGYLRAGTLELQRRLDHSRTEVPPAQLVSAVREALQALTP
jgi:prolyl-tRNA synthetase